MKINVILLLLFLFSSCGLKQTLNYSSDLTIPDQKFIDREQKKLDYSEEKNWAFRSDIHNFKKIIPKNYNTKNEKKIDVSVFYIHPTTLFSSKNGMLTQVIL